MEQKLDMHPALEAEIMNLAAEIQQRKEKGGFESQEVVRGFVGDKVAAQGGATQTAPSSGDVASSILPKYANELPVEDRLFVEKAVDDLWHDGDLGGAVKKVQAKGLVYIDLFRDVLAGKLHDILKQRGIL